MSLRVERAFDERGVPNMTSTNVRNEELYNELVKVKEAATATVIATAPSRESSEADSQSAWSDLKTYLQKLLIEYADVVFGSQHIPLLADILSKSGFSKDASSCLATETQHLRVILNYLSDQGLSSIIIQFLSLKSQTPLPRDRHFATSGCSSNGLMNGDSYPTSDIFDCIYDWCANTSQLYETKLDLLLSSPPSSPAQFSNEAIALIRSRLISSKRILQTLLNFHSPRFQSSAYILQHTVDVQLVQSRIVIWFQKHFSIGEVELVLASDFVQHIDRRRKCKQFIQNLDDIIFRAHNLYAHNAAQLKPSFLSVDHYFELLSNDLLQCGISKPPFLRYPFASLDSILSNISSKLFTPVHSQLQDSLSYDQIRTWFNQYSSHYITVLYYFFLDFVSFLPSRHPAVVTETSINLIGTSFSSSLSVSIENQHILASLLMVDSLVGNDLNKESLESRRSTLHDALSVLILHRQAVSNEMAWELITTCFSFGFYTEAFAVYSSLQPPFANYFQRIVYLDILLHCQHISLSSQFIDSIRSDPELFLLLLRELIDWCFVYQSQHLLLKFPFHEAIEWMLLRYPSSHSYDSLRSILSASHPRHQYLNTYQGSFKDHSRMDVLIEIFLFNNRFVDALSIYERSRLSSSTERSQLSAERVQNAFNRLTSYEQDLLSTGHVASDMLQKFTYLDTTLSILIERASQLERDHNININSISGHSRLPSNNLNSTTVREALTFHRFSEMWKPFSFTLGISPSALGSMTFLLSSSTFSLNVPHEISQNQTTNSTSSILASSSSSESTSRQEVITSPTHILPPPSPTQPPPAIFQRSNGEVSVFSPSSKSQERVTTASIENSKSNSIHSIQNGSSASSAASTSLPHLDQNNAPYSVPGRRRRHRPTNPTLPSVSETSPILENNMNDHIDDEVSINMNGTDDNQNQPISFLHSLSTDETLQIKVDDSNDVSMPLSKRRKKAVEPALAVASTPSRRVTRSVSVDRTLLGTPSSRTRSARTRSTHAEIPTIEVYSNEVGDDESAPKSVAMRTRSRSRLRDTDPHPATPASQRKRKRKQTAKLTDSDVDIQPVSTPMKYSLRSASRSASRSRY